jgi:hypothetical protein
VAFNPRANYTDRATAAGEISENVCGLGGGGCCVAARRIPTAVFLVFLNLSRYFFFQVPLQLYSRPPFFVTCVYKHIPEPTLFNPEDGGRLFTQNVGYTVSHPKKTHSDYAPKFCKRNYIFCDVTVIKVCTALSCK